MERQLVGLLNEKRSILKIDSKVSVLTQYIMFRPYNMAALLCVSQLMLVVYFFP